MAAPELKTAKNKFSRKKRTLSWNLIVSNWMRVRLLAVAEMKSEKH
jgi:hypothetical protein